MLKTLLSAALLLGVSAAPALAAPEDGELVAALQDQDPDIRALAASLLAEEAEIESAEALTERLLDRKESWRVRVAAAEALASQGREDASLTARLVDLVVDRSEDWRVRAAALEATQLRDGGLSLADALASIGEVTITNGHSSVSLREPLADGSILDALSDPDPRMRRLAQTALEAGLELAEVRVESESPQSPCFSQVLQQVLSQARSATGTLTVY